MTIFWHMSRHNRNLRNTHSNMELMHMHSRHVKCVQTNAHLHRILTKTKHGKLYRVKVGVYTCVYIYIYTHIHMIIHDAFLCEALRNMLVFARHIQLATYTVSTRNPYLPSDLTSSFIQRKRSKKHQPTFRQYAKKVQTLTLVNLTLVHLFSVLVVTFQVAELRPANSTEFFL